MYGKNIIFKEDKNMKNIKKLVALGLTTVMVLGSTVAVFAEGETAENTSGTAAEVSGTAAVNGYVNKNVYSVKLPTAAKMANAMSYKVDPQGLVAETNGAEYGSSGITVGENEGVLFKNTSDDAAATVTGVSGASDILTVTNKSSRPLDLAVEVYLKAATSEPFAGTFSTTSDFSANTDKTANLYIGLSATGEQDRALKVGTAADASGKFTNNILANADAYKVTYTAGTGGAAGTYSYALDSAVTDFPVYEFQLVGAINPDGDSTKFAKKDNDGKIVGTMGMPTVELKFTPTILADTVKDGIAVWDGETLYLGKADATDSDGGFGTSKPTSVIVNGKNVQTIGNNDSGYATVTYESVWKAYGYSKLEDVPQNFDAGLTAVKWVVDSVTYFAEMH